MSAITGSPKAWARDFALIGTSTSVMTILLASWQPLGGFVLMAPIIAGLTGGALGMVMPGMLEWARRRVPLTGLLLLGVALGGLWGGTVGGIAAVYTNLHIGLATFCAAIAGAIHFGFWWFPYTFQTVLSRPTWPVVLLACLSTPLTAAATVACTVLTMMLLWSL